MASRRAIVLGGARSGKSAFAERLLETMVRPMVYIATARAFDGEMKTRIDQHKARRSDHWRTVEAPMDAAGALAAVTGEEAALLDCATLWLSNQVLAEADVETESARLLGAIRDCAGPVVVVSNEIGQGVVPDNALARRFRDQHGRLNQQLAAEADLAVLVAAGLPLALKGALPQALSGGLA